jgi:hypothetical protein
VATPAPAERNRLFAIQRESIIDTKLVYTIFHGKIVYDAKSPAGVARH